MAPDDVPELLDEHIGKGQIIERLWRFVLLSLFFAYYRCHHISH